MFPLRFYSLVTVFLSILVIVHRVWLFWILEVYDKRVFLLFVIVFSFSLFDACKVELISFLYETLSSLPHDHWSKAITQLKKIARIISVHLFLRFEVFTAATMKNAVFWDVAPCKSLVNRRFGGTYRLHIQGRQTLIFLPWRWRRYFPPKRRFTQDIHGATSQKTAFSIYLFICYFYFLPAFILFCTRKFLMSYDYCKFITTSFV
jgi:hypothetical protein